MLCGLAMYVGTEVTKGTKNGMGNQVLLPTTTHSLTAAHLFEVFEVWFQTATVTIVTDYFVSVVRRATTTPTAAAVDTANLLSLRWSTF